MSAIDYMNFMRKLSFPAPWLYGCLRAEKINYYFTTELFVQSCTSFLSRSDGPLNQVLLSIQQKLYSLLASGVMLNVPSHI